MPSAKKIGRMVTADVDKALANIGSTKPEMKDDGAELKAAVAPKKAPTFAEAFRAARKDPEAMKRGTFTYGGKSFSTKMANEGAKPAVATRRPAAETPKTAAKSGVKPETEKFVNNLRSAMYLNGKDVAFISDKVKPSKRSDYIPVWSLKSKSDAKPAAKPAATTKAQNGFKPGPFVNTPKDDVAKRYGLDTASFIRRLPTYRGTRTGNLYLTDKLRPEPDSAKKPGQKSDFYRPGEKPPVALKAKGGKIDGCAVRGKTRAMRKK